MIQSSRHFSSSARFDWLSFGMDNFDARDCDVFVCNICLGYIFLPCAPFPYFEMEQHFCDECIDDIESLAHDDSILFRWLWGRRLVNNIKDWKNAIINIKKIAHSFGQTFWFALSLQQNSIQTDSRLHWGIWLSCLQEHHLLSFKAWMNQHCEMCGDEKMLCILEDINLNLLLMVCEDCIIYCFESVGMPKKWPLPNATYA